MQKKLTISIDEKVYRGLYAIIGERKISQFIENLLKPDVLHQNLEAAYQEMAADTKREHEANEWNEGMIADVSNTEK